MKLHLTPWLIVLASTTGAGAAEHVVEAELRTNVAPAFVNPAAATNLPRVLIIGDSISIGYTDPVRKNLKEVAAVFRPGENCQHSAYVLANLKKWLGSGQWDVIHFNAGIWDTHWVDAQGNLLRGQDTLPPVPGMRVRHTPEQYREHLTKIVAILRGTGAKLIWASTTPIMRRTGERFEAIPTLNRVAAEVMEANGVVINDLYAYVLPHAKEWQEADQVHFNATGNAALGKQVARTIEDALKQRQ